MAGRSSERMAGVGELGRGGPSGIGDKVDLQDSEGAGAATEVGASDQLPVAAPRGQLLIALTFTIEKDRIAAYEVIADPARLRRLDLAVLTE